MKRASEICTCSFHRGLFQGQIACIGEAGPCGELRWEGRGSRPWGLRLGSYLGTFERCLREGLVHHRERLQSTC